ncbi:MAG: ABC transporter ATP-binding protein [ANME-2 cluster archaeon]|nr:ABC transporter ATP-binding protein [ANME-2 cluster archaeon]MBC2702711.1 ABC transporter ATP-binding protein [ANME-2 cluster archaeon]MBC2706355.1 ABC transporter ATP-binding protein [ANME-2 cluster archaeon]MBC2747091.1 ABC transporter ATP-binding protein [ANME-2 cluster archaeon]MBC2762914.1 ABC transporter ATP-binding protein [ANME-2 cluster archaeon]
MLSIKNLNKTYHTEEGDEVVALSDINLDVADKEFVCFIGPSGCGKTTLLRITAGLEKPDSGTLTVNNEPITGPGPDRGMVFQEYSLFPWRTVLKNVTFSLELKKVPKSEREKIARNCLEHVGLSKFVDSYPHELSGGMKQRVAIARAIVNDPKVLLMDEPFGAVDAQTRNRLQHELLNIWEKKKKTVLFITHSVDEAVFLADKVVVFTARPGRIKEVISIDLPRPRERTSFEANAVREHLLATLGAEIQAAID